MYVTINAYAYVRTSALEGALQLEPTKKTRKCDKRERECTDIYVTTLCTRANNYCVGKEVVTWKSKCLLRYI